LAVTLTLVVTFDLGCTAIFCNVFLFMFSFVRYLSTSQALSSLWCVNLRNPKLVV